MTKEVYDKQSEALNRIAIIVSETPGLVYIISEEMESGDIPEGADLKYAVDSSAEFTVYREEHYDKEMI